MCVFNCFLFVCLLERARIVWSKICDKLPTLWRAYLPPGATQLELAATEKAIGFTLPESLRASLTVVNGQDPSANSNQLFTPGRLLAASELVIEFGLRKGEPSLEAADMDWLPVTATFGAYRVVVHRSRSSVAFQNGVSTYSYTHKAVDWISFLEQNFGLTAVDTK